MLTNVTIKDVAEHAQVAVSTVSRVINNQDRVSLKTREKVRKAIDELGYVKNNFAASIKTGKTRFIVIVVPEIINEFYTAVICGVEAVASTMGYYTLVYTTDDIHAKEEAVFNGEFGRVVDGIILVPSVANPDLYLNVNKPTVLIDRTIPNSNMYSVTVNNYQGASLLVEELVRHGHRKIAMLTGPKVFNICLDRLAGYEDVLKSHMIPVREDYIRIGNWYQDDGYRLTNELLELDDPPTAIFAANNLLCMGSAECICDRGLAIGKDISLVGFDDSLVARYIGPGITGIHRATDEMGRIGAQMLLALLNHHPEVISEKNVVLDVELIRRDSVAKI